VRFSRNQDRITALREEAEERDARRRAEAEGLPYLDLGVATVDPDALTLVPEERERRAKAAPVELKEKRLKLAVYSPKLKEAEELVEDLGAKGYEVDLVVSSERGLEAVWGRYLKEPAATSRRKEIVSEAILDEARFIEIQQKVKSTAGALQLLNQLKEAPTGELIESIWGAALVLEASDVHLEPRAEKEATIRFRIDGMLKEIGEIPIEQAKLLTNRIKLFSNLKLNVTDAPQDGRFTIGSSLGDIEVRTSIVPAEFGEAVVTRILNPKSIALDMPNLGFRHDDEKIISTVLKRPNGMILVTGPTGEGKTTTLYAFLKRVKTSALKIITVEDPIEYHLSGIEQTEIDPETGYTFVAGLRSILRQDPDIILVGEVRDLETAEVAIHAALTGHLVFSTLHTNNASGAIPRLVDLGVKPGVIGPALALIVAQRLVRRLCPYCRQVFNIEELTRVKFEQFLKTLPRRVASASLNRELKIYRAGKGCDRCDEGYRGRIGIFEILEAGSYLDLLMKQGATETEIEEAARKKGMITIQEDGILKVLQGITSLEEIERASGPINWLEPLSSLK